MAASFCPTASPHNTRLNRNIETDVLESTSSFSTQSEIETLRQLLKKSAGYGLELTKKNGELERRIVEIEEDAQRRVDRADDARRSAMAHFTNQEEENQLQTQSLTETTVNLQKDVENAKGSLSSLREEIETLTARLYELEEETKSANARTSVAMRKANSLEQELRKLKTQQGNMQGSVQTQCSTQKEHLRNINSTVKSLTGTISQLKACDLDAQSAMRALEERVDRSEQTVEHLVAEAKEYFYLIEEARSMIRRDDANTGELPNTPKTSDSNVFALELERFSSDENSTMERAEYRSRKIASDHDSSHPSTSERNPIPLSQDSSGNPLHFTTRVIPASTPISSHNTIVPDAQGHEISSDDFDATRKNQGSFSMKKGLHSSNGSGGFKYAAGLKYAALMRETEQKAMNSIRKWNDGVGGISSSSSSSSSSGRKGLEGESREPPLVVHCWAQGKQQRKGEKTSV